MNKRQSNFIITQKWLNVFNKQIQWRECVHGKPLSAIQKIKAARAVSHQIFPTYPIYKGIRGHELRDMFRKEILKTVGVDYKERKCK